MLRFVLDAFEHIKERDAFEEGRPAWVLPYELVDYFGEMLDPRVWADYQDALGSGGAELQTDESLV